MTRAQSLAIISDALARTDDVTLAAAAAHLSVVAKQDKPTAADLIEALPTDSDLPRDLSPRELALIEQSKQDFQAGRTFTIDEASAYIDAALERRRRARSEI